MMLTFITHSLGFGGAEKMLAFVANELQTRGHQISIINLNSTYMSTSQQLNDGISIYDIEGKTHGLSRLNCLKEIVKIAKQEKSEVLIGFTLFPNVYASLTAARLGIPAIISERGDPYRTIGSGIKDKLLLAIVNRAKGGVFQTEGAREYYSKGLQKRGIVIPNPIFINSQVPVIPYEQREKTVVSVGRLDNYQKRYDVMLQAFQIFREKHPEYTLKLYGDGADVQQIKSWTEELGIADGVRFMGLTKQPMQDIAADGMFLITSDYEGISNSLLEAMAVGLPCVSTDHTPGGARLLIQHGENGLLAPVEDARGLAEAMCKFADDPELAEKCGNNAKNVIHRFDPQRIIDLWEDYCEKLAK